MNCWDCHKPFGNGVFLRRINKTHEKGLCHTCFLERMKPNKTAATVEEELDNEWSVDPIE